MLGGIGVALLAIIAVTVWYVSRPGSTNPVTPTPTPIATNVALISPTPLAGAATFTPVAGTVITGPHVLGITAGVGMSRGTIAGAAPIAVTFSDDMDQASAQAAFALAPQAQGNFKWQGKTLLFTPASALQPSTPYTITVAADAKTSGGAVWPRPCRPVSRPRRTCYSAHLAQYRGQRGAHRRGRNDLVQQAHDPSHRAR